MNVGSLFSGAGLLDYGLTLAGFDHAWFCEQDDYCRRLLELRWPGVPIYDDVRTIDGSAGRVDLIAGGFPCQPFSAAGKQRGLSDERWLWPEFARLVGELRPRYVLVENVPGLLAGHGGMGNVVGDLAALGYDAEWDCLPASAFGAPHRRDRVFVVAYAQCERRARREDVWRSRDLDRQAPERGEGSGEPEGRDTSRGVAAVADPHREGQLQQGWPEQQERGRVSDGSSERGDVQDADRSAVQPRRLGWGTPQAGSAGWWAAEPDVGRVAHGVPHRLDRLAALGNGCVPQVAQWLGERIVNYDRDLGRSPTAQAAPLPPPSRPLSSPRTKGEPPK